MTVVLDTAKFPAAQREEVVRESLTAAAAPMNVDFQCAAEEVSYRVEFWQLGRARLVCSSGFGGQRLLRTQRLVRLHSPSQQQTVVLETAAQEFAEATSQPPSIYQLSPDKAREVLEGVQAYAAKLRAAGVPVTAVRYSGIIHDFVVLHPLAGTHAARAATAQGAAFLCQALHGGQ